MKVEVDIDELKEIIKEEQNVAPLRLALLLKENEDLLNVGAARYPVFVNTNSIPSFLISIIEKDFPYVTFTQNFSSDLMLLANKQVIMQDALTRTFFKNGLLCQCKRCEHIPYRRLSRGGIFN